MAAGNLPRRLLLLALLARGADAFPSYLTCERPLIIGHTIMGKEAVGEDTPATSFEGKECGGTFTPGEDLTVAVSGGGTYMFTVQGATIGESGATCDGTRFANMGTSQATYAITTSADATTVEAWIGRGTGPTSADMPVAVHAKCTLTASSSGPATSPTSAPATSPSPSTTPAPTPAPTTAPSTSPSPSSSPSPSPTSSPSPSSSPSSSPGSAIAPLDDNALGLSMLCLGVALLCYSPYIIGVLLSTRENFRKGLSA